MSELSLPAAHTPHRSCTTCSSRFRAGASRLMASSRLFSLPPLVQVRTQLPQIPPTGSRRTSCSSSRSSAVGSALRENPFAPYVPCHRVIASTLYIGGFGGEWLPSASGGPRKSAAQQPAVATSAKPEGRAKDGTRTNEKLELLKREGVRFDSKGFLIDKSKIWDGKAASAE